MDKNLRADFYNYLNKNCKLPDETEDKILKLNLILTNSFSPQNQEDKDKNKIDNNKEEENNTSSMTNTLKRFNIVGHSG